MESRFILRQKRKARVRAKITGTAARPRLSVFKSNRSILAQIIDDAKGETLASARVMGKTKASGKELGIAVARAAIAKKIKTVVFDRSGYRFHGAVKEIADGAREGGLII